MKNLLHKLLNFIVLLMALPLMTFAFLLVWLLVSIYLLIEKLFVFDADGCD